MNHEVKGFVISLSGVLVFILSLSIHGWRGILLAFAGGMLTRLGYDIFNGEVS